MAVAIPLAGATMARTLLVYVEDLLSGTQVRDTAQRLGYAASTVASLDHLREQLAVSPHLLLVDVSARPDWPALVEAAHAHGTPVVAFGNHMDLSSRDRALEAGVDGVVANSLVATDLAGVMRKYARGDQG